MDTATLTRTKNMVIVTLPPSDRLTQDEYERALDWANAYAADCEPTVIDHGDVMAYMWPAAA